MAKQFARVLRILKLQPFVLDSQLDETIEAVSLQGQDEGRDEEESSGKGKFTEKQSNAPSLAARSSWFPTEEDYEREWEEYVSMRESKDEGNLRLYPRLHSVR